MKEEHKGAIEVSVIFHEGQRMFAVPKQPAPVPLTDAEIEQLASKHLGVGDGERGMHYVFGEIDFARAILAAAQPAPVQEPWGYGRMSWGEKMFLPTLPSVRDGGWMALYTAPPAAQRQWVGLTDEEFEDIELGCRSTVSGKIMAMQKVEAKLRSKNEY
jgi:hypothetical protein